MLARRDPLPVAYKRRVGTMPVKKVLLRDVPFSLQDEAFICGPHNMRHNAEYKGKKIPIGVLAIFCSTSHQKGTTCANMVWGARLSQLFTRSGTDGSMEVIRHFIDLGYPVMVYLFNPKWPDKGDGDNDRAHYATVTGYDQSRVYMHDTCPDIDGGGPHMPMPIRTFQRLWKHNRKRRTTNKKWYLAIGTERFEKGCKGPIMQKPRRR